MMLEYVLAKRRRHMAKRTCHLATPRHDMPQGKPSLANNQALFGNEEASFCKDRIFVFSTVCLSLKTQRRRPLGAVGQLAKKAITRQRVEKKDMTSRQKGMTLMMTCCVDLSDDDMLCRLE